MKRFQILLFYCFLTLIFCEKIQSSEVLIIGGGPTGLATAIEAHKKGAHVTIIEKRASYSRPQFVFLLKSSLDLLESWNVALSHLQVLDFGGEHMGLVRIKNLEKGLNARIKELRIKKIQGEFRALEKDKKEAIVAISGENISLPYDFLVAADGVHSKVRDFAGIECECLGQAVGVWTFVPFKDHSRGVDVSPILKKEDYFIRRISVPTGSIIFLQSFTHDTELFAHISLEDLKEKVAKCEWFLEVEKLETEPVIIADNVSILLQKAKTFSSSQKGVLVLGDAAATASFFHGMGVNTSLQTAVLAGDFFQNSDRQAAYVDFNHKMEEVTDQLINFSRFLFEEEHIDEE